MVLYEMGDRLCVLNIFSTFLKYKKIAMSKLNNNKNYSIWNIQFVLLATELAGFAVIKLFE